MYKELQDKKQNALLLSLREQQDLYMAAANKKGVIVCIPKLELGNEINNHAT
jgi:hypothetical protein